LNDITTQRNSIESSFELETMTMKTVSELYERLLEKKQFVFSVYY